MNLLQVSLVGVDHAVVVCDHPQPSLRREPLYPLSYRDKVFGISGRIRSRSGRLRQPTTSSVAGKCSFQLSYRDRCNQFERYRSGPDRNRTCISALQKQCLPVRRPAQDKIFELCGCEGGSCSRSGRFRQPTTIRLTVGRSAS